MALLDTRAQQKVATASFAVFALVPVVYLWDGYQFANLPKLFLLTLFALQVSLFRLGLSITSSQRGLPASVILFVVVTCAQMARSLNPSEASIPLFVLTGSVTVAFGVAHTLDDVRRMLLFRVVAWTAGIVSLVGILETWGVPWAQLRSAGRPSATMGFRNTAATYAVGCLPWGIWLLARRAPGDRAAGAITSALVLLFILYTRSRGAWAGMCVAAVVGAAWYLIQLRRGLVTWIRPRTAGAIGLSLAGILYLGSQLPQFEDVSPSRLDEKKQSIQETVRSLSVPGADRDRMAIWGHTLEMTADHALIGTGLGNWSAYYPWYDRGDVLHIHSAPRRPHNDYLWIVSELGVVGVGAFVCCLIAACLSAYRNQEPWRVAAACSMLAIATHSLFSFPREQAAPSMILWLAIALCLGGPRKEGRVRPAVTWAVLLVVSVAGVVFAYRAIHSDRLFAEAMIAQKDGNTSRQMSAARASLDAGTYDHRVFLLLGDSQTSSGLYREGVETFTRYAAVQPYLAAVKNNLGKALNALGDHATAERVLIEGREVLPKDRHLIQNLSDAYRQQGKVSEALALYRDLEPLTAEEHQNLGLLFAEADSLDRAIDHYDAALRLDPDRTEAVYSKSGIQLIQGRLQEAINGYVAYLNTPDPNPTLTRRSRARLRQAYVSLARQRMDAGEIAPAVLALESRARLGEMTADDHHTLALPITRLI